MRTIRDFVCSHCGQVSEKLVDSEYKTIECPECQGDAVEQMAMPAIRLDGTSGDFPGAHAKWSRIREEHAAIQAKRV